MLEEEKNKSKGVLSAVHTIILAILQSQSHAARMVSGSLLSLYYGVGLYVSKNTRVGAWGTGAIKAISEQLKRELPGLRGFSEESIKKMRIFSEFWSRYLNRSPSATDLENTNTPTGVTHDFFSLQKWSPITAEIVRDEFLGISFSHHMEILNKTRDINEVLNCIHETVIHHWDKYTLRDVLKVGIVGNQYHLEIYGEEMLSDLLFFNRDLNALVAIELKIGKFKPAYLGQLYAYLQVLDDKVRKPHENPSIGIVLCKSANQAYIEYAVRDYNKPIGIATYKTISEMPKEMQQILPGIEDLKKIMDGDERESFE